ncbi:MAG: galactokinase [Anaerolineae bacterium]|nr:galactokinase [Anaerolineae bacterium]
MPDTTLAQRVTDLKDEFAAQYGAPPEITVRAPGRVNLIGEHTDYNDGYVFPIAIDRSVLVAASPRADRAVRLYAADFGRRAHFSLDHIVHAEGERWSNYQRGVGAVLEERGFHLPGLDAAIASDVPIGAGLSSSAAIEVAMAVTWQTLGGFELDRPELALLCQRAENTFVGVNCGIMDQFISALGSEGAALFVDCRTLDHRPVPLPDGVVVVIMDTKVQRGLADSAYNQRRAECEEGVRLLRAHLPAIEALRDVPPGLFQRYADELPETVRARCRHVVFENQRVLDAIAALSQSPARGQRGMLGQAGARHSREDGENTTLSQTPARGQRGTLGQAGAWRSQEDGENTTLPDDRRSAARFGELMNASHISLRDDYEVSCRELDAMVEAAWAAPGVIGARMTGAGFGGCAVALVEAGQAATFSAQVAAAYRDRTGVTPSLYLCTAEAGASLAE